MQSAQIKADWWLASCDTQPTPNHTPILKKVKLRGLEKVRWLQTLVDIASDSMITLITGANPW